MLERKWPILSGLLLLILPCGARSFPDYPVLPVSTYPISVVKSGLTIATHPVEDIREQRTYFDAALTKSGYLPVLIVMENASAGDSFLIRKDAIKYGVLAGSARSGSSTPPARTTAGERTAVGELVGYSALSLAACIATVFQACGPALPFSQGLRMISRATDVQQNLLKNELQSRTLSPGASAHGFLYVPVAKGAGKQQIHLSIAVTRAGGDDAIDFDLVF